MGFFQHEKAVVSKDAQVGDGTRIWAFTNIAAGAKVGNDCNVCDGCFVEGGAVVGDRVTLKNNVAVFDGVTLEHDVFVGANVSFINDRNPRSQKKDWVLESVSVKQGATIGAGATIMCGVVIGQYSFVGAGAVVTKNIPDYALVVGNPAKQVGWVDEQGFKLSNDLKSKNGTQFVITEKGIEKVV